MRDFRRTFKIPTTFTSTMDVHVHVHVHVYVDDARCHVAIERGFHPPSLLCVSRVSAADSLSSVRASRAPGDAGRLCPSNRACPRSREAAQKVVRLDLSRLAGASWHAVLAMSIDARCLSRLSWLTEASMAKNSLRRPELIDTEIEDENGKLIGTVRVKPTSILWAPNDAKKWRRVSLAKFIEWIEDKNNGELVDK